MAWIVVAALLMAWITAFVFLPRVKPPGKSLIFLPVAIVLEWLNPLPWMLAAYRDPGPEKQQLMSGDELDAEPQDGE
jgi:hypothetical protein